MSLSPQDILVAIIAITAIGYLFEQWLDLLNLRHQRTDIPKEVADFYDADKYQKSLLYHKTHSRFGFVTSAFSVTLSLIMLYAGGFGWIDSLLRQYLHHEIWLALAFFGVIMVGSDILSLPFQLYSIFVIEERFGFNKTSPRTFVLDKVKGYLLGALLGGALLAALIYLINSIGTSFWIWFGLLASAVILFMNMFYASIILPLFNKLTPLPEGELRSAIEAFARKVQFPLTNVFVMDGSRRSNKANAFFSGIGRRKKIVLYDTLIQKHSTEELVAVLAHEVGHFKKKHIVWSLFFGVAQVFFMLFVLSKLVFNENLSLALGGTQQAIHLNLLAFAILFTPLSGILGLAMSIFSRKNEFEADAYARQHFGSAPLAMALKKLSVDSLSNLYPHPLYVFFHYSHPPLLKRLEALVNK